MIVMIQVNIDERKNNSSNLLMKFPKSHPFSLERGKKKKGGLFRDLVCVCSHVFKWRIFIPIFKHKIKSLWNLLSFRVPLSFFLTLSFFWLQCAGFRILVPRPRDWTHVPCRRSTEAQPLHCQGSPPPILLFCLLKGVCSSCLVNAMIIWCNMKLPVCRGRERWIQMSLIYLFNVVWLLTRNSAMWKFSFLLCKIRKVNSAWKALSYDRNVIRFILCQSVDVGASEFHSSCSLPSRLEIWARTLLSNSVTPFVSPPYLSGVLRADFSRKWLYHRQSWWQWRVDGCGKWDWSGRCEKSSNCYQEVKGWWTDPVWRRV